MPLHNEDEIGRPVSGTKIAEIVAPGVTALAQFKRLFVTMFATIRSLGVGSVIPPGPGNLSVENNLTVGGQIIAPSLSTGHREYFVFDGEGASGNDRNITPVVRTADSKYRVLRDGNVTGVSAQMYVDTPGTMQGNADPFVNVRVQSVPPGGVIGSAYHLHVSTKNPGATGNIYVQGDPPPPEWWTDHLPYNWIPDTIPVERNGKLSAHIDSTPNQSLTPSITRLVIIRVEVTYDT